MLAPTPNVEAIARLRTFSACTLAIMSGCFSPSSSQGSTDAEASSGGTSSAPPPPMTSSSTTQDGGQTSQLDTLTEESAQTTAYSSSSSGNDGASSTSDAPPPTCRDGVANGDELDVDCGGPVCQPCPNGASCSGQPTDCISWFCGPITGQCEHPRSCNALYDGGVDVSGVYTLDPDGLGGNAAFGAYCRMNETGGWVLLAMIHPSDRHDLPEPNGWFAATIDPEALTSPIPVKNAGLASLGAFGLIGAIEPTTLVEFELLAEDDTTQTASWYKAVGSPLSFLSWFDDDAEPTLVCSDVAMTQNCSMNVIAFNGDATFLGGMSLSHYGYSGLTLHMRDDDDLAPQFSGISSHTFDADGNAWHDDYSTHWGNALRVWLH